MSASYRHGNSSENTFGALLRGIFRDAIDDAVRQRLPDLARMIAAQVKQMSNETGEFLSAEQAAKIVGVEPDTIREWAKRGTLPSVKAGRLLRVRRVDLEAFLARQGTDARVTEAEINDKATAILSARPRRAK